MTVQSATRTNRRGVGITDSRVRPSVSDGISTFAKAETGGLNATAVSSLISDEPARFVCIANQPQRLGPNRQKHRPFNDRTVLMRLAQLARRCCGSYSSVTFGKDPE